MTSQLQEVIHLTKSLSLTEQLELLKALSFIIQEAHTEASLPDEADDTSFSIERFRSSWQQAVKGQTLPLAQLWDGADNA